MGGDMANLVMTMLPLGTSSEDRLLGFMAETEARIQSALTRTDRGYAAEFAVPIEFLNEKAGSDDWQDVRIVVSVYDRDEGDHGTQYLQWHPYRYGPAALPWSHTFMRSR